MNRSARKHSWQSFWGVSGALLCVVTVGCAATASDDEAAPVGAATAAVTGASAGDSALSVRGGRLRFSDVQAFSDAMHALGATPADQLERDHFEKRFAGFTSLATARDVASDLPPALQIIMNRERSYQIGGEIFVRSGDDEYIIDESDAGLVAAVAGGAPVGPYVAAGRIHATPRARTTVERPADARLADGDSPALLDAKYQHEFFAVNHWYKFVDEVYVDVYSNYVNTCFRAKFEYKDKFTWKSAGQSVYKDIAFAYVRSSLGDGPANYGWRDDSSHLTVCTAIVPAAGTCVTDIRPAANYYSEVTSGNGLAGSWYAAAAEWNTEFKAIKKCN